jgi:hypothetical protein
MTERGRIFLFLLVLGMAGVHPEAASQMPAAASQSNSTDTLSSEQIGDLIRQAADKDLENDKRQRDYTYVEREVEQKLDGNNRVKSTETRTHEIMMLYGEQVERLTAKDDKPLSAKDAAKEEERIQKIIDKRKNESEDERRKRLQKQEKEREQGRQFVREVADAFNFRFVGTEMLGNRETYAIDADPRPGYQPHMKEAKFLPKFRFRVWVDKAESQWVKLDIHCIETVSIGVFLARLHRGSNLQIEQIRINDEVWLPKHVALKLDARIALLKGFNLTEDLTYRDYKKFHTDTKILGAEEIKKSLE